MKLAVQFVAIMALSFLCLVAQEQSGLAQVTTSAIGPEKVDDYGELPIDDEAARLDFFANRLNNEPATNGRIIAYCYPQMERGYYLRRIHGIGRYLTDTRGIGTSRVEVVDGGYREKFSTELWLIPEGAEPPEPVSKLAPPSASSSAAYKFDEECLDCSPVVGLYLEGFGEGLKFYAEALREDPDSRALMIVRPDKDVSLRKALNEARKAKGLLNTSHGIKPARVVVKSARSRGDGTAVVEMWIVPAGVKLPAMNVR